jgi:hypothetical protein
MLVQPTCVDGSSNVASGYHGLPSIRCAVQLRYRLWWWRLVQVTRHNESEIELQNFEFSGFLRGNRTKFTEGFPVFHTIRKNMNVVRLDIRKTLQQYTVSDLPCTVQFTQIRQFTSYGGGKLNFDVF